MIRLAIVLVWLLGGVNLAAAQADSSAPTIGSVGVHRPTENTPTFGASFGPEILRHRSPAGSLCLSVVGYARSHLANSKVYDHVITAKNSCAQRITIQVCYYKSMECVPMEIPGGERKETVLGTLPGVSVFRFEFREKS